MIVQQCFILLELNYTLCYNVKQGGSFLVFDDLWRSGNQNNYNNAYCMAPSGGNTNNNVTNAYGVRPALHSLTKWCKFSCIRQMVGKWLLKFSNWRYEYEGTYYPAFIFSKGETNSTFPQRLFFCGMCLKKWSSYFFIYPTKQLFLWGIRKHLRLGLLTKSKVSIFPYSINNIGDPSTSSGWH